MYEWLPDWIDRPIFEKGLWALAIFGVIAAIQGFISGFREGRASRDGSRWQEVWREPVHKRLWNRIRGKSSATIEDRRRD